MLDVGDLLPEEKLEGLSQSEGDEVVIAGAVILQRLHRKTTAAIADLAATVEAAREEPNWTSTARSVVEAAWRLEMRPKDALLFDLDHRPAEFLDGFLSKRGLTRLQDRFNPPTHHHLVRNKLAYHVVCRQSGVPTPPVLAVVRTSTDESGRVPGDLPLIRDEAGLSGFLATQGAGTRLVLKMAEGSYGKGLLGLVVTAEGVLDAEGRRLGPAEILRHCHARRAGGGFLIQPWLEPDQALRPLMPGRALGTIRVVTVLRDDEVLLPPFSSMRIPVGANITDAFAGGKSGNLTAAVDVGTGMVGEAWGPSRDRPHRLDPCPVHPDTGVTIAGFALPHWAEVRRLVAEGARAFPQLRTLGWDVAITASGIQLLEANHHWDPHGPQIALQRGIRTDMAALVAGARPAGEPIGSAPVAGGEIPRPRRRALALQR